MECAIKIVGEDVIAAVGCPGDISPQAVIVAVLVIRLTRLAGFVETLKTLHSKGSFHFFIWQDCDRSELTQ